uniref:Uncharacterized protein n=1 Tax=Steinernema glaseri TaxID=37863 RepID=A0A1I8AEL9_9BILA
MTDIVAVDTSTSSGGGCGKAPRNVVGPRPRRGRRTGECTARNSSEETDMCGQFHSHIPVSGVALVGESTILGDQSIEAPPVAAEQQNNVSVASEEEEEALADGQVLGRRAQRKVAHGQPMQG